MGAPLQGIRVADFSRVIAGPVCAMTLADMGADVVKIEHPVGGDDTRGYRPPEIDGFSPAFLCYNRNKRGIALDLNVPEGLKTARALIDSADIVIENFRTGLMARYGLDYETVAADRPELIYLSISAYGRDGPFASRAGYDPVVQAESGFMSMTGYPDGEPMRTGVPMIDVTTGMTAAQAVLVALFARKRTGKGQFIEVPLFDTGFSMTLHASMEYMAGGESPTRVGNGSFVTHPLGVFHASDGPFFLTIGNERAWRRLVLEVLERRDVFEDPDFTTGTLRAKHRDRLTALLEEIFATDTRDSWIARIRAVNVPVGPLRTLDESMASMEVRSRDIVREARRASGSPLPDIRSPIHLSGTPLRDATAAPGLGEHTDEVLAEWLGYGSGQIEELRKSGAAGDSV